jgi:transcription antitermination factor NusG
MGVIIRYPEDRPLEDDIGLWWVMHTKPNCEKSVAAYFQNREISYYLPLYKIKRTVGALKKIREVETPLFRGYICFALEKEKHSLLYDLKKIVKLIEVDDQTNFVRELAAVAKLIESGRDLALKPGISVGRRVVIRSGPLEGVSGVVVRKGSESHFALSVEMFNKSVLLKLDANTIIDPS